MMLLLRVTVFAATELATLTVRQGRLLGRKVEGSSVESFLGIPFAAPPIGTLRWQPPEPPADWTGIREALLYANSCVQSKNPFSDLSATSEDCLYLNVWRPTTPPPDGGFPVMLFFYGGSWEIGSAMFPLYGGERLSSHGVISIAANVTATSWNRVAATSDPEDAHRSRSRRCDCPGGMASDRPLVPARSIGSTNLASWARTSFVGTTTRQAILGSQTSVQRCAGCI